jgi:hypothetical protein
MLNSYREKKLKYVTPKLLQRARHGTCTDNFSYFGPNEANFALANQIDDNQVMPWILIIWTMKMKMKKLVATEMALFAKQPKTRKLELLHYQIWKRYWLSWDRTNKHQAKHRSKAIIMAISNQHAESAGGAKPADDSDGDDEMMMMMMMRMVAMMMRGK